MNSIVTIPATKEAQVRSKAVKYRRKLSAIERYNLVLNEIYRYNVIAVFEGEGELDLEQWQRAVAIAAEANPGARVRLKGFLGFARWVDSGNAPKVHWCENDRWDGRSERDAIHLEKKFDVLNGDAILDIVLLPGKIDRILFRTVHAAMDARGLIHFMRDVFRVLRGENPVGSTSTIIDADIREKYEEKVVKKEDEEDKPNFIPLLPVGETPSEMRYVWRRLEIDPSVGHLLQKMSHFLAQYARKFQEGEVAFTFTVDYRNLREEVDSTANLTGYIRVNVNKDDKPRDIMKRLYAEIRNYADCANPKVFKILPWLPLRFLINMTQKNMDRLLYTANHELPSGGVVSLGKFDFADCTYEGFKPHYFYGIPGSVGKFNVVIIQGERATSIIFSAPEAYNDQGQLDDLVAAFKDYVSD